MRRNATHPPASRDTLSQARRARECYFDSLLRFLSRVDRILLRLLAVARRVAMLMAILLACLSYSCSFNEGDRGTLPNTPSPPGIVMCSESGAWGFR